MDRKIEKNRLSRRKLVQGSVAAAVVGGLRPGCP